MPERWTTEVPARTTRLTMSISISPSRITGMIGRSAPVARRVMTTARASSSSGEKGIVRMSSTPRSNAFSFVRRSPRRVRPRTGVTLLRRVFEAPTRARNAVLSSWSMSTTASCGPHSCRIASASARLPAARTAKTPWLSVSVMRSMTSARSWSTSARRASRTGAGALARPTVTALPRCVIDSRDSTAAWARDKIHPQARPWLNGLASARRALPEDRRDDEADCRHTHDDRGPPPDHVEEPPVRPLAHRRPVVRDEHHQDEERRGDEAVDHRAQDQRSDRVDLEDRDDHPDERRSDDHDVELGCPGEPVLEPRSPAERLGHRVLAITRAITAHVYWTAVFFGSIATVVPRVAKPYCAPAW